jgi:hypothetical protein
VRVYRAEVVVRVEGVPFYRVDSQIILDEGLEDRRPISSRCPDASAKRPPAGRRVRYRSKV